MSRAARVRDAARGAAALAGVALIRAGAWILSRAGALPPMAEDDDDEVERDEPPPPRKIDLPSPTVSEEGLSMLVGRPQPPPPEPAPERPKRGALRRPGRPA